MRVILQNVDNNTKPVQLLGYSISTHVLLYYLGYAFTNEEFTARLPSW